MPFSEKRIAAAYRRTPELLLGPFRKEPELNRALGREIELLDELRETTKPATNEKIGELVEQLCIWLEYERRHYFNEGWKAGVRAEKKQIKSKVTRQ